MYRYEHIDIVRSIWIGPEPPKNPYNYPIWIDTDNSVPYAYVFQLKKWISLDELLGRKTLIYKFAPTITLSTHITDDTNYVLAFNLQDVPIPEELLYYFPNLQENTITRTTLVASNKNESSNAFIKVVYTPTDLATIEYPVSPNTSAIFDLANLQQLNVFGKGVDLYLDLNITFDITKSIKPTYTW